MRRIEVFYLSKMNQQRAFYFFRQIYSRMGKIDDKRFHPKLHAFMTALNAFDKTLKANKGPLVDKLDEENLCCNKEWRTLKDLAQQALSGERSDDKRMGKAVLKVMEGSEDPTALTGPEKIDLLKRCIKEIENKTSLEGGSDTDIPDTVARLKRATWAYKQFYDLRNIKAAGECLTRESLEARKKIEVAYYAAVEFLNAMFIYKGADGYEEIIDQINRIIGAENSMASAQDTGGEEDSGEEESPDNPEAAHPA
jgi:hypothetical protein